MRGLSRLHQLAHIHLHFTLQAPPAHAKNRPVAVLLRWMVLPILQRPSFLSHTILRGSLAQHHPSTLDFGPFRNPFHHSKPYPSSLATAMC
ncbi:hypothetical protein BDW62DRAFT_117145 [Aspergillus aurantiobrunneus]